LKIETKNDVRFKRTTTKKIKIKTYFKMQNMSDVPSVANNADVTGNGAKKRLVLRLKKDVGSNNNDIAAIRNEIESDKNNNNIYRDDRDDDDGKNISIISLTNIININNQISTNETSSTGADTPAPEALDIKLKIGLKKISKSEELAKAQCDETIERDKPNEYYYKHREQKLEYQKKYNKERGDKIKDYNKDYYTKQREKILAKTKTKVMCDCGCEVQLFNMNCHKKTKKHLHLVEAKIMLLTAIASN
jgi:hypothetical protein